MTHGRVVRIVRFRHASSFNVSETPYLLIIADGKVFPLDEGFFINGIFKSYAEAFFVIRICRKVRQVFFLPVDRNPD